MHTLLPYGAGKHMGGKLAEVITTTVKDIFDNDKQGECSVEIVRMIASLVKKKGSNVNGKLVAPIFCAIQKYVLSYNF